MFLIAFFKASVTWSSKYLDCMMLLDFAAKSWTSESKDVRVHVFDDIFKRQLPGRVRCQEGPSRTPWGTCFLQALVEIVVRVCVFDVIFARRLPEGAKQCPAEAWYGGEVNLHPEVGLTLRPKG